MTNLLLFSWGYLGPTPLVVSVHVKFVSLSKVSSTGLSANVARSQVYAAAQHADKRLGSPVNPVLASTARWDGATDPLMSQIKAGPVVEIEPR